MEETTTVSTDAPDTGSLGPNGAGDQPGADPASEGSRQGAPSDEGDQGRSRDEGGRFSAAPARSVEDLIEAANNGDDPSSWPKAERAKFISAARNGIKTEDEYLKRSGAPKTAGVAPGDREKPPEGDPAPEKPTDKGQPDPVLASILKAIHPSLEKPEDAVRSIQELQGAHTRATQKVREYETQVLPEIQSGIVARLKKGPEGLRELYQAMQVEIPDILKGTPTAPAAPADSNILSNLKDEDFLDGKSIKSLVPNLIQEAVKAALAETDKKYGGIAEDHGKIRERLVADAKAAEIAETRKAALQDAQIHSDFWGQFEAEDKLKDKAEKIWADSVTTEGRLKSDRHPEWPKLEKILKYRRGEFLEGQHNAASYQDFLYRRLHAGGKFADYMAARERNAKVSQAAAAQRRVQPAIAPQGAAPQGGLQGLRIPKTVEDIQAMSEADRRELLKRVKAGKIAVRSE